MEVSGFNGYIFSSYSSSGPSGGNRPPSYDTTGGQAGGGGGIIGGGQIWSGSSQIIWVSAGGVKYPIQLEPGWNDVGFWIPSIFPDDTWIESPIIIEAPGYILIPGGFEWGVITGVGAPPEPIMIDILDRITPIDNLYIEFRQGEAGVTSCYIEDIVGVSDEVYIDIIKNPIKANDIYMTDTIQLSDSLDLEFRNIKISDINIVDMIEISDNTYIEEEQQ